MNKEERLKAIQRIIEQKDLTISKLQEENSQLLLLRTEAYHEVHKLHYDQEKQLREYGNKIIALEEQNERLKKESKQWEASNFLNKDIAMRHFDDCVNEKHKNLALEAEIESLKGNLKEVDINILSKINADLLELLYNCLAYIDQDPSARLISTRDNLIERGRKIFPLLL